MARTASLIFLLVTCVLAIILSACGGGGTSAPAPINPPEPVTISLGITRVPVVQSGGVLPLAVKVTPASANQNVTWMINNVAGGSSSVGTVAPLDPSSGTNVFVYTPPDSVSETLDVTIKAISVADPAKSATATVTAFARPRIGTRINTDSNPEFYDRATGAKFIPRGMNYVRLTDHLIVPPVNAVMPFHATFAPGLYDATRVETALASMENYGYNFVRVWLDPYGATAGIGNPNGTGVSTAYVSNLADFIRRAKTHHIYVTITTDDLPRVGGYQETIDPSCTSTWPGCWNLEYTRPSGITAGTRFWPDLIVALAQQHAAMDAIFSYQLREEYHYLLDTAPLNQSSGVVLAANGKSYNMADPAAKQALMNESLIYWTDQLRGSIQLVAPGALVGVGFVTGANPSVPPFTAAVSSKADYIDGHTGPGEGTTLAQDMSGWGQVPGVKPVILGEFAARTASFPIESDAATALKAFQIESCNYEISGWALWSWDTAEHDTLGFPHWYALRGTGLVNAALAPANRPDPCQN